MNPSPQTPNPETDNSLNYVYTFGKFLHDFFPKAEYRKWALKELIEIYERKTGKKLTKDSYHKTIKRDKSDLFVVIRHEQLYLISTNNPLQPTIRQGIDSPNSKFINSLNNQTARIHSSHKWKFGVDYQGIQPTDGQVSFYGKKATLKRYFHKVSDRISIVAFTHRLNVWVHHPKGTLTADQEAEARSQGIEALMTFTQARNLTITSDLSQVLLSHHVVEARQLNAVFKPLFRLYEDDIYKQIGSKFCKTSHKGKMEDEGIKREDRLVLGKDVATGLEYWLLDLAGDIQEIKGTETERKEALVLLAKYTEQVKSHLSAIQEMRDTLKEMRDLMRR